MHILLLLKMGNRMLNIDLIENELALPIGL